MVSVQIRDATPEPSGQLVACTARCGELEGIHHDVFHELEQDVATAHKATKPLLSIFKRRGQIRFAIAAHGSSIIKELERCSYRPSAISSSNRTLTNGVLALVFEHLRRTVGVRINGLTEKSVETATGPETYFTYHIDLEAA